MQHADNKPHARVVECGVCCETFNASTRKEVQCCNAVCTFSACRGCAIHYIMDTTQDAHCMNCRNVWNHEFLDNNFTKKFVSKDYKTRREVVLLEREKSLLPATQPLAETIKIAREARVKAVTSLREYEKEMAQAQAEHNAHWETRPVGYMNFATIKARLDFDDDNLPLLQSIASIQAKIQHMTSRISLLDIHLKRPSMAAATDVTTEKRAFVRACPATDCRGFLSTQWKCGLCSVRVCKDCHEIVSTGDADADVDAHTDADAQEAVGGVHVEHVCDTNTLKTVALMVKDTKACPKCAANIFKIDGCDQMYCTQCNTAFSWRTGAVEKGIIHNPHYYQYLRDRNGGIAPRNPGDNPDVNVCEGVMIPAATLLDILQRIFQVKRTSQNETAKKIMAYRRIYDHNQYVELPRYAPPNAHSNEDLRIQFLLKDIDEHRFKQLLQQREKKHNKNRDIFAVMTMFQAALSDILGNVLNAKSIRDLVATLDEIEQLCQYTNESMRPIANRYSCVVPDVKGRLFI